MNTEPSESVMVRMTDGVGLATDIHLPPGNGPWPSVLIRHPYAPCEFMPLIGAYVAEHGYAAVIQIVRGKNRSEGKPEPFVHDRQDASDTLDWIEGASWSDGRVATFGDSYYGFTEWAAAASGHRALRAMATRMTSSDIGRDWMYQGDVFNLGPIVEWAAYTWADRELLEFEPDWAVRPLSELVPAWLEGRRVPALDRWRTRQASDSFWTEGIYGRKRSPAYRLGLPTLHRAAWWDPFRRGQIADWQTAFRTSRRDQELVIDATDHYDHEWLPDEPVGDMMADVEAFTSYLPRYLDEALEFFDRHVRERDAGTSRSQVRYRLANGPWHSAPSWPPPEARKSTLHLTPHGLADKPDGHSSPLTWVHDPDDLVPSAGDYWASALEIPDERALAARDDVLTFDSDELSAPLDLAGPASLDALVVADGAPSLTVVAQLMDVFPDGRALRLTEGARRMQPNGDRSKVVVDLGPLGYRVEPGHRLRLHVSSTSFPRYMPDTGAATDPWTTERWDRTEQRLCVGGRFASRLRLTRL